ncbi:Nucleotide-diphospho-sugar transferase [uncultured Caudovirales phage]|uniref:Nucleotide-diphospho-sugar transferase n=1 Tax=uncultured Caudovirales phage TaxID=2100421 RepID=A0A6J7WV00_9CAUD|nr:Nucleotide-diphospho-sugar transferase [uncultured Caudovirales phage]
MKLYYIITDSFKNLEEKYFVPSFNKHSPRIELNAIYYNPPEIVETRFQSPDWIATLTYKSNIILKLIEDNLGDVIMITDVDMVIVKDIYDYIVESMESKDILHQREGYTEDGINAGVTVIKCSEKTKKFFEYVRDSLAEFGGPNYLDQSAMDDYYKKDNNFLDLEWGYLCSAKIATRYSYDIINSHRDNIMLLHANVTHTVKEKEEALNDFLVWIGSEPGILLKRR